MCERFGASFLHIDACDGSTNCPGSLTLGPLAIEAIHRAAPSLLLDVHVVAHNLLPLLEPIALAGATRITVQFEYLDSSLSAVTELFQRIISLGASVGVSLAPDTPIEALDAILALRWLKLDGTETAVESVDILAVNPGFGGQKFRSDVLNKVRYLKAKYPDLAFIAVDGGINIETARQSKDAGANVIVAGTAIFGRNRVRDIDNEDDEAVLAAFQALRSAVSSDEKH
jgi:ribulose-phosphate 3-epimerase